MRKSTLAAAAALVTVTLALSACGGSGPEAPGLVVPDMPTAPANATGSPSAGGEGTVDPTPSPTSSDPGRPVDLDAVQEKVKTDTPLTEEESRAWAKESERQQSVSKQYGLDGAAWPAEDYPTVAVEATGWDLLDAAEGFTAEETTAAVALAAFTDGQFTGLNMVTASGKNASGVDLYTEAAGAFNPSARAKGEALAAQVDNILFGKADYYKQPEDVRAYLWFAPYGLCSLGNCLDYDTLRQSDVKYMPTTGDNGAAGLKVWVTRHYTATGGGFIDPGVTADVTLETMYTLWRNPSADATAGSWVIGDFTVVSFTATAR